MREILFRGKRANNREWVEGGIIPLDTDSGYVFIAEPYLSASTLPVHEIIKHHTHLVLPETIGQYTGLADNNGTRIFEGDIVRFGKNTYQIIFSCGSFALYDEQGEMISKIGGINDHCYSLMQLYIECCWEEDWAYDIEVIGNIHDNPELLEGATDERK